MADVLLWEGESAGQIENIVEGDSTAIHLELKMFEYVSSLPYGSLWRRLHCRSWYKPKINSTYCVAMWWRWDDDKNLLLCLH